MFRFTVLGLGSGPQGAIGIHVGFYRDMGSLSRVRV